MEFYPIHHYYPLTTCGVGCASRKEGPVNQRVSGNWAGDVGVLLWLVGVKYVSSYFDG